MLQDFKTFILRGNVVDLAVGIVIGVAFGAVVGSLVSDVITPIVAAIGGQPNFDSLVLDIGDGEIRYGSFLNAVLSFLIIAAAVYFLVVHPVNALMERRRTEPDVERPTWDCPNCLSSIPASARVCAFCTREVGAPI
jgi:large conductance mechanosensitive channel